MLKNEIPLPIRNISKQLLYIETHVHRTSEKRLLLDISVTQSYNSLYIAQIVLLRNYHNDSSGFSRLEDNCSLLELKNLWL